MVAGEWGGGIQAKEMDGEETGTISVRSVWIWGQARHLQRGREGGSGQHPS